MGDMHMPTAMAHGTAETVECPLCGEQFDPSAATGDDATAGIGNSASEGAVEGGDDGIDASAATGEGDTSAEAAEGEDEGE